MCASGQLQNKYEHFARGADRARTTAAGGAVPRDIRLPAPGRIVLNNTGFLVGRTGVVSIDTTSTERRTRAYLETIASVSRQPVRTLVNTHHHGDHTHGNCLLPLATVEAIGGAVRRSSAPPPPAADVWSSVEWGDLHPEPPFVTFDHLTVWVDDLRVELRAVPTPAHTTQNNVVAWIPERSLLFHRRSFVRRRHAVCAHGLCHWLAPRAGMAAWL